MSCNLLFLLSPVALSSSFSCKWVCLFGFHSLNLVSAFIHLNPRQCVVLKLLLPSMILNIFRKTFKIVHDNVIKEW